MLRIALLALTVAVLAAATALATHSPYHLPEPKIDPTSVVKLTPASGCVRRPYRITVRIVPPSGVILARVRVRAGSDELVRVNGVAGETRLRVRLPSSRSRMSIRGTTAGGQTLSRVRTMRRCSVRPARRPKPPAPPATQEGGGED